MCEVNSTELNLPTYYMHILNIYGIVYVMYVLVHLL